MSHEEKKVQPTTNEQLDQQSDRKTWVAPTVSDSPVNDLTSASPTVTATLDGVLYS